MEARNRQTLGQMLVRMPAIVFLYGAGFNIERQEHCC
jgi:hypothetical protein